MFYFINKLVILLYNTIIRVIIARKKTKQQNYVIISKRIETKRNYTIKYKPYVILTLELYFFFSNINTTNYDSFRSFAYLTNMKSSQYNIQDSSKEEKIT